MAYSSNREIAEALRGLAGTVSDWVLILVTEAAERLDPRHPDYLPKFVEPLRRCDTNQVAPNGDCVACGAVEGEACRLRKSEAA